MKHIVVVAALVPLTGACSSSDEPAVHSRSAQTDAPKEVVTLELKEPDAILAEKFTAVSSVRELSTGRILVTDGRENRIVLADFRVDNTARVGRIGRGPGEYQRVGRLWPLPGDSSLMHDRGQWRWILFHGSRIVGTVSPENPAVEATHGERLLGVDAHTVTVKIYPRSRGLPTADSATIVRVRRSDGRSETITRSTPYNAGTPTRMVEAAPAGTPRPKHRVFAMSLIVGDQVAHFADGWSAVARHNPYRVDWCRPDGECITGPILENLKAMTDDEKRAHLAVAEEMMGWPHTKVLEETNDGWPKLVPAFIEPKGIWDGSALHPLPDGRLLVERFPMSVPQWKYDVIDRRGRLVGRLILPRGERIVAVGKVSIYTVAKNEFDLQELRRHPWLMTPLSIERD